MTHRIGTREEWQAARDELARKRRELPWVAVEKAYTFETADGTKSLADLFDGRSQLLVYHFMFGPTYEAGCPVCSSIADTLDPQVVHLKARDTTLLLASRAPLEKLLAYRERMGWSFPWVSSFDSDFNYDFATSRTERELREGGEYNFAHYGDLTPTLEHPSPWLAQNAARTGVAVADYVQEAPGMSAFALSDGVVYHTYSAYARGLDALWGAYQWLDRAPLGRNETQAAAWRRRTEYEGAAR